MRYSTPRRSRAHSEHGVASASRMSSITSPMSVCSMRYSQPRSSHVLRDEVVLVVLVAGVDVDGDEREVDRRALAQDVEDLQQRPAVLAAGQPDHDAVAVLDHLEVDDRLGRLLRDARLERMWRNPSRQFTGTSSRFTVAGQVSVRARAAPSAPSRAAGVGIVDEPPERTPQGRRRRRHHEAGALVGDELGRATAVVTRDHRPATPQTPPPSRSRSLRRAAGTRRRGSARGDRRSCPSVSRPGRLTRSLEPQRSHECGDLVARLAVAGEHGADARGVGMCQRFDDQAQPLERREARHRKQVRLVVVARDRRAAAAADTAPRAFSSGHAASRCRIVSDWTNSFETLRVSR